MPDNDPAQWQPLRLGKKEIERVNPPAGTEMSGDRIDVYAILQENLRKSLPTEKPVDMTRRESRRKRDYWLLLVAGNAAFAAVLAFTHINRVSLLFAFSGMIFFTAAITWVMWGVMGDY